MGNDHITQHIRYGLRPLPFGTLLPSIATSYMLETLGDILLGSFKNSERKRTE
ncbi:MAG: hypothetical protein DDT42_01604 [candidate division WS2 bacterium]|uniref:Uncharacterized protein n=1 Tax=Psychracetigena formicireducens TaxID=2986056 RepID=A0A9E2BHM9_PSYF1|nr:hypothetical protein [Candidatus Psychracetigena formicireducens]